MRFDYSLSRTPITLNLEAFYLKTALNKMQRRLSQTFYNCSSFAYCKVITMVVQLLNNNQLH